ncbi:hypothetical protein [Companilactobacillus hulinensis]|uniref:hypothetical protein n=1 Tax=Companilactobacillus hulinensis TaxID=2486007 RepID=UPI0013DD99BE|nr:hypothetical protein [Companilactobacillus hulinensis]
MKIIYPVVIAQNEPSSKISCIVSIPNIRNHFNLIDKFNESNVTNLENFERSIPPSS